MKKLIYLLILSLTFSLTGCANKPLEVVEFKLDGQTTNSPFSNEGFDKLEKDQIEAYITLKSSFDIRFNQKVNECEIYIYLLDNSLNLHEVNNLFGDAINKPDISWNRATMKEIWLGASFAIQSNFDYFNDKYCGLEIRVDGETLYTAFKIDLMNDREIRDKIRQESI